MVSAEAVSKVIEIFYRRTKNPEVINKIKEAGWKLSEEDFFNYVMGVAWNHSIPLTPKDVAEIKAVLGLL